MEPLIRLQHNDHRWHVELWRRRFVNADGDCKCPLTVYGCDSVSSGFSVTHTHTTSLSCVPINVVTFVQQEHGLSSSTTLWSLRGLTSVPKAQQFNDRVHKGIVQVKVLEKLGTSGPHWAEKYVAFSILRTEIFYTAETLYVDVRVRVTEWEYLQV